MEVQPAHHAVDLPVLPVFGVLPLSKSISHSLLLLSVLARLAVPNPHSLRNTIWKFF